MCKMHSKYYAVHISLGNMVNLVNSFAIYVNRHSRFNTLNEQLFGICCVSCICVFVCDVHSLDNL